jgi:NAD+ kinase
VKEEIGLLFHPDVRRQQSALKEVRALLDSESVPYWEGTRDTTARGLSKQLRRTRLIMTLGGDGTFLYGARMAAPHAIPLLGVNLGRLGFLTEVDIGQLGAGLSRFLGGDYRLEERTVLRFALVRRKRHVLRSLGVNEVVVHKGGSSKLIRLEVELDAQEVGTIDADGVVIASATGSTAYALASGGPILEPELRDLVLAPMNPFALSVRPIVFSPGTEISITLPRGRAMLTVDGFLNRRVGAGDTVRVRAYERRLRVVRFTPPETFFRLLRQKIGWGTPLVPRENTSSRSSDAT